MIFNARLSHSKLWHRIQKHQRPPLCEQSKIYSFDTDVMITHRSIVSSHFRFPTIRFLKWFTFKKTKIQVWNLKELLIIVLLKTLGCDDNLENDVAGGGGRKILSLALKSGAICGFYLREKWKFFLKISKLGSLIK